MDYFKHFFKPGPSQNKYQSMADLLPFIGFTWHDGILGHPYLLTKFDTVAAIFKVGGIDYLGVGDSVAVKRIEEFQAATWGSISSDVVVFSYHRKRRVNLPPLPQFSGDGIEAKISTLWESQFTNSAFVVEHYLLITERLGYSLLKGNLRPSEQAIREEFENTLKTIASLKDIAAVPLSKQEMADFVSYLANCRDVPGIINSDDSIAVGATDYHLFPQKGFMEALTPEGPKYVGFIGLNGFTATTKVTDTDLLRVLFQNPFEVMVMHAFRKESQTEGERIANVAVSDAKASGNTQEQERMAEVSEAVLGGQIELFTDALLIQIVADNENELSSRISDISNALLFKGAQTAREGLNLAGAFWCRFPCGAAVAKKDFMTLRTGKVIAHSIPHLSSFATIARGADSCAFGPYPVTYFPTMDGTLFQFIFHCEPGFGKGDPSAAHTMVFGGTGSGKTTLILFLIANVLAKFPDLRAVMFDRLFGLYTFTKYLGGIYHDTNIQTLKINPFSLDLERSMGFIIRFFDTLANKEGDPLSREQQAELSDVVGAVIRAAKLHSSPNMGVARSFFGAEKEGGFYSRIKPVFEPDSIFSGELPLDFGRITSVDMNGLEDHPALFRIVTDFFFEKAKEFLSLGKGLIIFVDELPQYLNDENFVKKVIITLLQQARKQNGIFIGASQSVRTVTDHPSLVNSQAFLNNVANLFFAGDKVASAADYGKLGVTDIELSIIRDLPPHHFLLKKRLGSSPGSVVINANLGVLGPYLNIFSSSSKSKNDYDEGKRFDFSGL